MNEYSMREAWKPQRTQERDPRRKHRKTIWDRTGARPLHREQGRKRQLGISSSWPDSTHLLMMRLKVFLSHFSMITGCATMTTGESHSQEQPLYTSVGVLNVSSALTRLSTDHSPRIHAQMAIGFRTYFFMSRKQSSFWRFWKSSSSLHLRLTARKSDAQFEVLVEHRAAHLVGLSVENGNSSISFLRTGQLLDRDGKVARFPHPTRSSERNATTLPDQQAFSPERPPFSCRQLHC